MSQPKLPVDDVKIGTVVADTPPPKTAPPAADKPMTLATTAARHQADNSSIPDVITTRQQYDAAYQYLAGKCHLMSPFAAFSGLAPNHGMLMAKVYINPDPSAGEVYQDKLFCAEDEVAISKNGLRRLALAGGWTLTPRILRAERNYWVVQATSSFTGIDGSPQSFTTTEEYDLRDDSPQVEKMSHPARQMARAHGLRAAEARALNAACREFGIRQKYKKKELAEKPFVIMRVMFIPDPHNQMHAQMVAQRALMGNAAFFPHAAASQGHALPELEPIGGMADDAALPDVDGRTAEATAARPAVPEGAEGMILIKDIKVQQINRKAPKTGTFPKWTVIDMNGVAYTTLSSEFHKALDACWKANRYVDIEYREGFRGESEIQAVTPGPVATATDQPF